MNRIGLRLLSRLAKGASTKPFPTSSARSGAGAFLASGMRKYSSSLQSSVEASRGSGHHCHWSRAALSLSTAAAAAAALAAGLSAKALQASEVERTFIAIKPDGVQRGLISEIVARFERKGYKLVAIKAVIPTKDFAEEHYDDLKGRPFFNGLTDFLSSGPVIAMVWEGPGVITYGRKMIGATSPQASAPGTIRGDLAIIVGRNIIHGSDGSETAKHEIALWFKPEELLNYQLDSHKWVYE
eukprot:TRINITY_DN1254_c0_g1_i3.p1 TRINITY_DN1254_c0_g1~~TRINITY_DN1254_c0_g1_i3.p1  ORF type:complete len:241 (-),score=62.33 TRINITY_DN1254_c0_g1_i3:222-944(-)